MTDEIIAEVWAAKDALSAQHGGSLRALYAAIKRGEAELAAKGIRVIPAPGSPACLSGTALQRMRFSRHRG
jgi:hypothetical protein